MIQDKVLVTGATGDCHLQSYLARRCIAFWPGFCIGICHLSDPTMRFLSQVIVCGSVR